MKRIALATAAWCTLAGCSIWVSPPSDGDNALLKELAGVGRIAVSPDNPYIASNLYLEREADRSETLRGFIEHRGKPDEIELALGESRQAQADFYYQESGEHYRLRKHGDDWVILLVESNEPDLQAAAGHNQPAGVSADAANAHMPPAAVEHHAAETRAESGSERGKQNKSFVLEPSGDVVHRVTHRGETLRLIVSWYTGDVDNIERIIRINGIEKPNMLKLGQSVRIPRYLLKNPRPLTAEEVEDYRRGKF